MDKSEKTIEEKITYALQLVRVARREFERCPSAENEKFVNACESGLDYLMDSYRHQPAVATA